MPDLFGLDLAGIIADALDGAGGLVPGTITRRVRGPRNPADPTAERSGVPQVSTFQGFLERFTNVTRVGSSIREAGEYISLVGNSIEPRIVPQPGDIIVLEDLTFKVLNLTDRDPAAALYTVQVSGSVPDGAFTDG